MIAVQTNDGKWRGEDVWPPADSTGYTSELLPGTYTDEADGSATDPDGVWTISPPLPYDAHLSGSGHVTVDVSTTLPRANLVVDVYDLDRDGTGPLITRQAHMIRDERRLEIPLDLWSADWKIPAGHRIGVKVADINTDFWLFAAPTHPGRHGQRRADHAARSCAPSARRRSRATRASSSRAICPRP